ncbi:hypothetical protein BDY24DRAFT_252764 [Mrakia frigida]|uniref:auxilin-like protein SWA2 n=1 Tax=Mrakia frigida TaxID=29902 RepID=UPI003FCC23F6
MDRQGLDEDEELVERKVDEESEEDDWRKALQGGGESALEHLICAFISREKYSKITKTRRDRGEGLRRRALHLVLPSRLTLIPLLRFATMDDLNDLVWTSPPSNTNKQPLPNSSRTGSPFSSFDMLANTSNRSYSPSPSSFNAPSSSSNLKPSPAAPAPRSAASSDAFASLLSLGGSSSGGLSMAEKAAKLADEARSKKEAEAKAFAGQGAFWDKFGGAEGANPSGAAVKSPGAVGGGAGGGLSALLALPQRISSPSLVPSRPTSSASNNSRPAFTTSTSSKPPILLGSPSNDLWSEFDTLSSPPLHPSSSSSSSKPPPPPTQPPKATDSSFDSFDLFEDLTISSKPSPSQPQPPSSSSRRSTPGDHDFGNREDRDDDDGWGGEDAGGLLGGNGSDDDDFMGAFNQKPKPSDSRSRTTSNSTSQPPPSQPSSSSRRPPSPPPHILGQIVEMGFSLSQARNALASTPSGLDVQAALEMLISESQTSAPPPDEAGGPGGFESEEERSRREEEEAAERRRRRRRRGPARGEAAAPSSSSAAGSGASTPLSDSLSAAQLQDQASKLLASTNLLGQSMFNRANAFWKEGKTQVQKAYEERQKAVEAAAGGAGKAADGRPKWMVDAEAFEEHERGGASNGGGGGFRDGDEEDEQDSRPSRSNGNKPSQPTEARPAPRQQREPPQVASTSAAAKVASLFNDEPVPYVSSNRRRPAPSTSTSNGSSRVQQSSSISRSSTPAPPAAPLRKRDIVSSSPSALEAATSHRTKGNEHFKLGQFGDAEAAYTSAIDSLPSGHLRLLPLLNNRAAARLKNGDHSGSAADSTSVINLVGIDYHPSKEHPLPSDFADLQLGEALVKALSKRAAAYEMGEKWEKAREDWDLLGTLDVGGAAGQAAKIPAMDGARRCRKMTDVMNGKKQPTPSTSSSRPPPPKPTPSSSSSHNSRRHPSKPAPPPPSVSTKPSEALSRLQASNTAQESEDLLRSQLKDSVEARLLAWKLNKETNVRALIASLDSVLWPELGWQKVGLHELVTDKQVKTKYTRAIAKVHPDKLNAGNANTTVEQRMIAGGVFGVLNEAWNASQN